MSSKTSADTARWSTLHRLHDPAPDNPTDLRAYVRDKYRTLTGYTLREFTNDGVSGLLVTGGTPRERADWCVGPERLTGLSVIEPTRLTGGLALIRTDLGVYALTYGHEGRYMLDTSYRDDEFGLSFAVRCLDAERITLIRNEIMDRRGRVDEYTMASGTRIDGFGFDRFSSLVRRICGTVDLDISAKNRTARQIRVECSGSTIKLPLATTPAEFLADLAEIEKVCALEDPLGDLKFIERVRVLGGKSPEAARANAALEPLLAVTSHERLAVGIPDLCLDDFGAARTFRLKLGAKSVLVDNLDVHALLSLITTKPAGRRLDYLNRVDITMFADEDRQTQVGPITRATDWLIAEVEVGPSRYYYRGKRWHEIGAAYLETLRDELQDLLDTPSTIQLPTWPKGPTKNGRDSHDEGWYNEHRAAASTGYQLFDKRTVVTPTYRGGGLEICDLLGPDCELVCVKKAFSSAPLNHLFAQAVTAVTVLREDSQVRTAFLEQVRRHTPTHRMLTDVGTLKVVFAILLKDGHDITVTSLFAFAQISLIKALHQLRRMNAEVTVVTLRRA